MVLEYWSHTTRLLYIHFFQWDVLPLYKWDKIQPTCFSGSAVSGHSAGRILLATSANRKYCCVAARANTPACLAGGNVSRVALTNADTRTFCLIWGCRCCAILPRHTVVFVLKDGIVESYLFAIKHGTIKGLVINSYMDYMFWHTSI